MRRGDISVVFKYIMTLVVGVMFLVFFIGFAGSQIGLFSSLKDYESAYGFDDALQALSVDENSERTLTTKLTTLFQFTENNIIVGSSSKKTDKIIFTSKYISGKEIYVATQSWHYPFAVTNLFYLSDINHKYIFLYDSSSQSFTNEFITSYDGFPSRFLSEVHDINEALSNLDQIKNANPTETLRFVFMFEPTSSQESKIDNFFDGESIIWLEFVDEENGYVHYDDADGIYLGKEMLIGAIVAENGFEYSYQYGKSLVQLISMCEIYLDKAALLQSKKPDCSYTSIQSNLNSYINYIKTGDNPVLFASASENVKSVNKGYGGNCPKLF